MWDGGIAAKPLVRPGHVIVIIDELLEQAFKVAPA